jgi:hypothetical protein
MLKATQNAIVECHDNVCPGASLRCRAVLDAAGFRRRTRVIHGTGALSTRLAPEGSRTRAADARRDPAGRTLEPGAMVLYDVRASRAVRDVVERAGGRAEVTA